jgi:hypothetical protein
MIAGLLPMRPLFQKQSCVKLKRHKGKNKINLEKRNLRKKKPPPTHVGAAAEINAHLYPW